MSKCLIRVIVCATQFCGMLYVPESMVTGALPKLARMFSYRTATFCSGACRPRLENSYLLFEILASLGIMGDNLGPLLCQESSDYNSVVIYGGNIRGTINCPPLMPREAILSGSYWSVAVVSSVWCLALTSEINVGPKPTRSH